MFPKHLKIIYVSLLFLFVVQNADAQSNYFKWSAGLSAGPNFSRTDVVNGGWGHTFAGTLDFHFTPFVTLGLEAQKGIVQGGDIRTDPFNRQFVNEYSGININFKMMLGEFINYNGSNFWNNLKGLYVGTGVGLIRNNITDIVRYKPSWAVVDPGYGPYPGQDKSYNVWLPFSLGFNYFLHDSYGYVRYAVNINAQSNFTFGEGLDGYNDPPKTFKNFAPDTYNVYSLGVKYFFGNIKVYRKTL